MIFVSLFVSLCVVVPSGTELLSAFLLNISSFASFASFGVSFIIDCLPKSSSELSSTSFLSSIFKASSKYFSITKTFSEHKISLALKGNLCPYLWSSIVGSTEIYLINCARLFWFKLK